MNKSLCMLLGWWLVGGALMVSCKDLAQPDLQQIEESGDYWDSEVSFRSTYDSLVREDELAGRNFLTDQAHYCVKFKDRKPFVSKTYTQKQTQAILQVLNDSSAYVWLESTPEYLETLVFYTEEGQAIGFCQLDPMGEVNMYPYRSLMKWGTLSQERLQTLKEIMNQP
ncbi:MAG: hypothetical protein AAFR61_21700 [Bacteroidota bacterium]